MLNYQKIITRNLGNFLVVNKKYHSILPEELQNWYCYTVDGGHNILACLKQDYKPDSNLEDYLVPVPVKSVLKGYLIKNNYVIVDVGYSQEIGLIFDPKDEEF